MKIFVLPEEGQIQIQIITFILIFPNTNKNNLHTLALGDKKMLHLCQCTIHPRLFEPLRYIFRLAGN